MATAWPTQVKKSGAATTYRDHVIDGAAGTVVAGPSSPPHTMGAQRAIVILQRHKMFSSSYTIY